MTRRSTTPNAEQALRRLTEAFNRRDFEAALDLCSTGAVWDRSAAGLEVLEGREAISGALEEWWRAYADYEQVVEEVRDLGNGATFGVVFQRGRLKGSSGVITNHLALVATWADGLIERVATYTNIDEGRAAAERLARERG